MENIRIALKNCRVLQKMYGCIGDLQLCCLFFVGLPVPNKASIGACGWVCCGHPGGMVWLFFLKNTRFFSFFSRARLCVFSVCSVYLYIMQFC